jgi:uncharacterized membrane protein
VLVRCFAYQFNVDFRVTMLLVLWALGWALIALAVLARLPMRLLVAVGALLVAGHNLFDAVRSTNPLWLILHSPGFVLNTPAHVVFVAYPLVPWIGVTALGYALGSVYTWPPDRRRTFLLRLGAGLTLAFLVLRGLNVYGDPAPWRHQRSALMTVLSFLNTNKYPPSLAFLLMTLGPAMLALAWVEGRSGRWQRPLLVFGRVPLFYFVVHFALLHTVAVVVCLVRYGSAHWMFESPSLANYPFTPPPGWGFSLPIVYLTWAAVVLAMYPLCRWFGALKARRRSAWLSYL